MLRGSVFWWQASKMFVSLRGKLNILAIILFGLSLTLRLYRLDKQSLWLDEGGTWSEITRKSWSTLVSELFLPTSAYPLYHIILKAWVYLVSDNEWALRFPSAVASAFTVIAIFYCLRELNVATNTSKGVQLSCGTSLLRQSRDDLLISNVIAVLATVTSPFAIWHAQDAKVYSIFMFMVAILLLVVMRVVRVQKKQLWVLFVALACISIFVHRLVLLPLSGFALALAIAEFYNRESNSPTLKRKMLCLLILSITCAAAGTIGFIRAGVTNGWQESGHIGVEPMWGIFLTFVHFSLDRGNIGGFLGLPQIVWLLPAALLTLRGFVLIIRDSCKGDLNALMILCTLVVPLVLFALVLLFVPLYESRYATMSFPSWMLLIVYPNRSIGGSVKNDTLLMFTSFRNWYLQHIVHNILLMLLLVVNVVVLLQPKHGLFSGAPVKEEWRQSISYLSQELHPDDLIILHPYYTQPLWDYYAPRVTPDPLPEPQLLTDFSQGYCAIEFHGSPTRIRECYRRKTDQQYLEKAIGKKRALLLIAPEHAATIDPPKTLAELREDWKNSVTKYEPHDSDAYGWLGLRFQYTAEQGAWSCGNQKYVGIEVMCQSYPSAYGRTGEASLLDPSLPLEATFGNEIMLRGVSINLFGTRVQVGGSLPITLYWQAIHQPSRNYSMFLHLCRNCSLPPLANSDRPPLLGVPPAGLTTTWRIGDPVHDERTLLLPPTLEPGRYLVLLGVRPADDDPKDVSNRLPVITQARTLDGDRVVLGEVEVTR